MIKFLPLFKSLDLLKQNLVVILTALLFFFLTVIAFFPGEMSTDTLYQYSQALSGVYTDHHPPIMSALWRLLLSLFHVPGGLFVLHNVCFWFFWCLLASLMFNDLKAKILVLMVAALPSLWSQWVVIWKDSELSICLLGAYLFVILAKWLKGSRGNEGKWLYFSCWGFSALLFFYSAAVRFNSFAALIPLAWYMADREPKKGSTALTLVRAFLILVVSYSAVYLLNYGILGAKKCHLAQQIQVHDIVGIFVRTGDQTLLPAYWMALNPAATPKSLEDNYEPENVNYLWTGLSRSDLVQPTVDPAQLDELRHQWMKAVQTFPLAYLGHRWAVFNGLIRIGKPQSYYPFHLGVNPNSFGLKETGNNTLRVALKYYFWRLGNTFLFKGWFYLCLAFIVIMINLFGTLPRDSARDASLYSAASALFYGCGYFFYAPASDFRYLYPTVTLSVFSALMLLSKRKNPDFS